MPTFAALTTLAAKPPAEALARALEGLSPEPAGVGVFEIEDGSGRFEVGAWFGDAPDGTRLAILAEAFGAAPFAVSEVPETDWVAHVRRELHPVEAGRFFLFGGHDADRVPAGRVPLLVEAQMAFGTGHHATTRGCLLAIDRLAAGGAAPARIADIGCGTAVLAMAAARVWDGEVIAADNDPVAVEVAEANLAANGLAGRVLCLEAEGFAHPGLADAMPFDLVLANILKGPLILLAPDMGRAVAPGGRAILSGILATQAEDVLAAYAACGFVAEFRDDLGEWTTLVLARVRPAA
ncbi:MAG: 50S ribosomal protein L11 methyltransferase [Paracoccaceae bacterium]